MERTETQVNHEHLDECLVHLVHEGGGAVEEEDVVSGVESYQISGALSLGLGVLQEDRRAQS